MTQRSVHIRRAVHNQSKPCRICGRSSWWHLLAQCVRTEMAPKDNGHLFESSSKKKRSR